MAIDERARHELYLRLEQQLGAQAATTLMEHLPPVGWADVATKQDLTLLESRLEARFERGFRQILVTGSSLLIAGFLATIAATVAAALIR